MSTAFDKEYELTRPDCIKYYYNLYSYDPMRKCPVNKLQEFIGIHGLEYMISRCFAAVHVTFLDEKKLWNTRRINKRKYDRLSGTGHSLGQYILNWKYKGDTGGLFHTWYRLSREIDALTFANMALDIGYPNRKVMWQDSWQSSSAVALAKTIKATLAFDRIPILADALEEAGMDHSGLLTSLRERTFFTPQNKVLAWLTRSEKWSGVKGNGLLGTRSASSASQQG